MNKTKGGQNQGWKVGMAGVGGVVEGKWRKLYLSNDLKKCKKTAKKKKLPFSPNSMANLYVQIKITQVMRS